MADLYLDHVLIAVCDLSRTAETFSRKRGLTVTPEGIHPGRGTHNRLVVFGPEYLELIAIRDASEGVFRPNMVTFLQSREGLFIFALGTDDIVQSARDLRSRGVVVEDPIDGGRRGSDGHVSYTWRQAAIDVGASPGSETFLIQHNSTVEERYTEPPEASRHPNGVLGIHHLTLAVRDGEAAAALWQAGFGLQRAAGPQLPGREVNRVRLLLPNCFLDLVSPVNSRDLSESLDRYGEGIYGIGFEVQDLPAAIEYLAARGVPTTERPSEAGALSAAVAPEHAQGVRFELVQTMAC